MGAPVHQLPPVRHLGLELLAPGCAALLVEDREELSQRLAGVADQVHLGRVADAEHAAVDVDLHGARLPLGREELGVGEARADHQERVAVVHQVPARLRAEQADGPGDVWQRVRKHRTTEERLRDAGAEGLGDLLHLVGGVESPGADEHRDALARVEQVRGRADVGDAGDDARRAPVDARVHGPVRPRRVLVGHLLYVLGEDDAGHGPLRARDAEGAVDEVAYLRRLRRKVHVLAGDVLEQRDQVDLLLVVPAHRDAVLLAHDRDDRLVVHLRVVEAVEKVDRAGARGCDADADLARELRVRARHERAQLLVARLDELDAPRVAAEGAHQAVDAVAGVREDALDPPLCHSLDDEVADRVAHRTLLFREAPPQGAGLSGSSVSRPSLGVTPGCDRASHVLAHQSDMPARALVPIEGLEVSAFVVPTDAPESDGTLEWKKTTIVVVQARAGGKRGLGWTYGPRAAAELVHEELADVVENRDAFGIPDLHARMTAKVRNAGRPGVASMAIAAVDACMWDLKAKLLDVPLVTLLGARRSCAPVYGSGGFTSYADARLQEQLAGWVAEGMRRVKLKVGREPWRDVERVRCVREAVGDAQIFVDANGAYTRKQAIALSRAFAELGVVWFEEPVSSDDLEGLRLVRDRASPGIDVAAGEYGFDLGYFRRMLEAGAVDVLQADATRCSVTGFLRVDALCEASGIPLSAHCAPALHVHLGCAAQRLVHLEYFHDHVRIEHMLFDGAPSPREGALWPDLGRPGLGLELRRADAARFAA